RLLRLLSSSRARNRGHRDRLSIASGLLEPRLDYRSRARRARSRFPRLEIVEGDLVNSSGEHPVPPRRGKKWDDPRERNYFSRLFDAGVCDNARTVAEAECRLMNSRASKR